MSWKDEGLARVGPTKAGRRLSRRGFLKMVGGTALAAPFLAGGACAPQLGGGAARGPIKIGLVAPFSDVYAVLGESIRAAMEIYFDSIGWKAGGRELTLLSEDEQLNPDVGLAKTRKLIEQDNIDIFTGVVSTGVVYAIRDTLHNAGLVSVISNAGGQDLSRGRFSPYIFRVSFSNWQVTYKFGEWVAGNVARRVATSAPDYGAGHDMVNAFVETFTPAGGQVLGQLWPPLGNTDYTSFINQLVELRPEATFHFYSGSDARNFITQWDELAPADIELTCAGFMVEEDILPAVGERVLGVKSSLHWAYMLDVPRNNQLKEDFMSKTGQPLNVFGVQGWDAAKCIHLAIDAVGGEVQDTEGLIAALEEIEYDDSPRGIFKMDPRSHNVVQKIYVREVARVSGELHNVVIDDLGEIADPGPGA